MCKVETLVFGKVVTDWLYGMRRERRTLGYWPMSDQGIAPDWVCTGSRLPGRGHAEACSTSRHGSGVMCVMRLARCSPNTFPLLPKHPALSPALLQLGRGQMKLWPKKHKWKLMYEGCPACKRKMKHLQLDFGGGIPSRGGLVKARWCMPPPPLPYRRCASEGSITDGRGLVPECGEENHALITF